MRMTVLTAAAAACACLASPAAAQRVWQDGRWVVLPHQPPATVAAYPGRWAPMVDGRWEAASRAPGGWQAYRRLQGGAALPAYWQDERFRIPDYLAWSLAVPPRGYYWIRYYDDAVLVDAGGHVWDSISGIAWSGPPHGMADTSAGAVTERPGAPYPPPPARGTIRSVDPDLYRDRSEVRIEVEPGYDRAPPPPPPYPPANHGSTTVAAPLVQVFTAPACLQACPSYGAAPGAARYYYGGGTTTVIISAPATTTTVEETTTTTTNYVRAATRRRHMVRRAPRHPRMQVKCCTCGCR